MTVLSPLGPFRALDNNGLPLNGGKLYTYEAGTSTPKATYTDVTGATPNANPVILDASGYANVWLGSGGYKFILKTSTDTTLWTIDNIGGDSENAFGSSIVSTATNLAITSVHQNALVRCTAALTLSLLAAAGAGQGFYFLVKNESSGNVTIDPSGAETIDGAATYVLYPNDSVIVICDGATWYTSFAVPVAGITTNQISTSGSSGVVLKNSAAATVATFGASAATTSVFAGAVTASTTLGVTGIATFSAAANTAKGADIASATTTDIGAATGNFVHITGTTTITGLGTIAAGAIRVVRFAGVLTLTHNATSLILPTGANITTAAGDTAIFVSEGSGNWRCVNYEPSYKGQIIRVKDEKSSGTAGGTFTSGAWQTRTLNTTSTNTMTGASLGSNQVTLPAGTFKAIYSAVGYQVQQHQTRLYNATDASVIDYGSTFHSSNSVGSGYGPVNTCVFTLSASKAIEIQHRCSSTKATDGFGAASTFGNVEVYADLIIERIG